MIAWENFHTYQSLCSYNWDNANSAVFIFKLCKKLADFIHFIHHKFCTFHWPPKICTSLTEQFLTFHPSLHESITKNPLCLHVHFSKKFWWIRRQFWQVVSHWKHSRGFSFVSNFKKLTKARLFSLNVLIKSPWCSTVLLKFEFYNLQHCKK